ncbi:uncharacterized protein MONOS_10610 [Monocercomonoides exilis]|uniref:uncharacterized protein n=1 Tax=Monocercomonoides exilis TaxID=2049356 RepID=UPI003559EB3E|nr:hypothetical protein MONOS_10610 [Monocercomonoides exilis]|eukprot:MONOS_10610.1-p1 / transcript=MONOS_10610.1 / gene=MONOS_10610 / organism=Monocercomonoides_exilis_PA203 / gene_product=unspecified product / transcript_product=unspecified product / location=Mono_scaffold00489:14994-16537(+) / protein_length=337 / sequence_SO=supercontig / SO=protein_coding / is_pseudo=false
MCGLLDTSPLRLFFTIIVFSILLAISISSGFFLAEIISLKSGVVKHILILDGMNFDVAHEHWNDPTIHAIFILARFHFLCSKSLFERNGILNSLILKHFASVDLLQYVDLYLVRGTKITWSLKPPGSCEGFISPNNNFSQVLAKLSLANGTLSTVFNSPNSASYTFALENCENNTFPFQSFRAELAAFDLPEDSACASPCKNEPYMIISVPEKEHHCNAVAIDAIFPPGKTRMLCFTLSFTLFLLLFVLPLLLCWHFRNRKHICSGSSCTYCCKCCKKKQSERPFIPLSDSGDGEDGEFSEIGAENAKVMGKREVEEEGKELMADESEEAGDTTLL